MFLTANSTFGIRFRLSQKTARLALRSGECHCESHTVQDRIPAELLNEESPRINRQVARASEHRHAATYFTFSSVRGQPDDIVALC